ncbi:hypothetical protein ACA910_018965 [Epithemia clementina (nom. ined.)]
MSLASAVSMDEQETEAGGGEDAKTRRSNRDRQGKRDVPLARIRVRYDMQTVPFVERNEDFLKLFRTMPVATTTTTMGAPLPSEGGTTTQTSSNSVNHSQPRETEATTSELIQQPPRRRSSRLVSHQHHSSSNNNNNGTTASSTSNAAKSRDGLALSSSLRCPTCNPLPPPFLNHCSVVWVPSKRSEWEDCISEMTAVCTTAARSRRNTTTRRRSNSSSSHYSSNNNNNNHHHNGGNNLLSSTPSSKLHKQQAPPPPATAPLSRDYISDRVDIDDPLNGYQIRHAVGGWLQGFILWTNFTTWTNYFRWDSLHPQSGMATTTATTNTAVSPWVDRDGSLAQALERLPRTGDPVVSGIIFENIAEIGLVGALGCGEYLLRMALDDIRSKKQYKYVVLQATESSRPFYEKFGFVRVGAICRYHSNGNNNNSNGNNKNNNNNSNGNNNNCNGSGKSNNKKKKKKKPPAQQQQQQKQVEMNQQQQDEESKLDQEQERQDQQEERKLEQQQRQEEQQQLQEEDQAGQVKKQQQQPDPKPPLENGTNNNTNASTPAGSAVFKEEQEPPPIVGYRHWTHANESDASLQMHGGPSYMMCLPLYPNEYENGQNAVDMVESSQESRSFLDAMMTVAVTDKPLVEQLSSGANGSTILSKIMQQQQRRSSTFSATSMPLTPGTSPVVKKKNIRKSFGKATLSIPEELPPPPPQTSPNPSASLAPVATTSDDVVNAPLLPTTVTSSSSTATTGIPKQLEPSADPRDERPLKRRKVKTETITSDSAVPTASDAAAPATPTVESPSSSSQPAAASSPSAAEAQREDKPNGEGNDDKLYSKSATKASNSNGKNASKVERLYYSVRGADGRFTRVAIDAENADALALMTTTTTTTTAVRKSKRAEDPPAPLRRLPKRKASQISASPPVEPPAPSSSSSSQRPTVSRRLSSSSASQSGSRKDSKSQKTNNNDNKQSKSINRSELRKQKVKSYPRARPHFYNRVVKPIPKSNKKGGNNHDGEQYFFVLHYNEDTEAVRLVPMEARGTMMGKRQGRPRYVCCIGTTDENFVSDHSHHYQVVPATMVMKTPFVAQEAWDIEDDDDGGDNKR